MSITCLLHNFELTVLRSQISFRQNAPQAKHKLALTIVDFGLEDHCIWPVPVRRQSFGYIAIVALVYCIWFELTSTLVVYLNPISPQTLVGKLHIPQLHGCICGTPHLRDTASSSPRRARVEKKRCAPWGITGIKIMFSQVRRLNTQVPLIFFVDRCKWFQIGLWVALALFVNQSKESITNHWNLGCLRNALQPEATALIAHSNVRAPK